MNSEHNIVNLWSIDLSSTEGKWKWCQWILTSQIIHDLFSKPNEAHNHENTLLTVKQNLSRALYEVCYFLKSVSEKDFLKDTSLDYICPGYNPHTKKRNEMKEVIEKEVWWEEIRSIGDISCLLANGNTLPPNKLMLVQRWDHQAMECPQIYPTPAFLSFISDYKKRSWEQNFIFIGTAISSSIYWTPHAQVQPNYRGTIQTVETSTKDNQRFTAEETSLKVRELNKEWRICSILALKDGNFAIMEVDNFLWIDPRPELTVKEDNWYEIHLSDENKDETLYARMAWDLSWNQGICIGWVELWTENLVFEKEGRYYWFYKRWKRGVSNHQMKEFFSQVFPEISEEESNTILTKVKKFNENLESLIKTEDNLIGSYIDQLWKVFIESENDLKCLNDLNNNKNTLQQKILLAFLMSKERITIEWDNIIDEKSESDFTILSPEHISALYKRCRGKLIEK